MNLILINNANAEPITRKNVDLKCMSARGSNERTNRFYRIQLTKKK